jgi:hypothetical protein
MARFEPYISLASRDKKIQEILEKTEKELRDTRLSEPKSTSRKMSKAPERNQSELTSMEPLVILDPPRMNTAGRVAGFHSKHVSLPGQQKIKRPYRCSNCGGYGHNAASCRKVKTPDATI